MREKKLFDLVRKNELEKLKRLVEDGADIQVCDSEDNTLLDVAFARCSTDTIDYLINHGATIRTTRPSLWSAQLGLSKTIVEYLLKNGADVNEIWKDDADITPIFRCFQIPDIEVLKTLVKRGADINYCSKWRGTPLAFHVKRMLGIGLFHNDRDALGKKDYEILEFLLENGADASIIDKENLIPLAVKKRKYKVVSRLLDYCKSIAKPDDYEQAMFKAIADNQKDVALKIAKLCPARKETMANAESIMRELAYNGELTCMKLLIDATGVSVNNQDENHDTPLFFALAGKKLDAAWFLINHGADIHAVGNGDETLLHCAARMDLELVKYLVENGLDTNAKNKAGVTPLHHAVCAERLDIAQYLLDKGAEVNVTDKDGIPLFLCAVFSCSPQTLEFLAAHGADCHAKDSKGLTAADFASVLNPKVLPCLLKLGVKTTVTVKKREPSSHSSREKRDYDDVTAEWYYRLKARRCRRGHSFFHQGLVLLCGNDDDE